MQAVLQSNLNQPFYLQRVTFPLSRVPSSSSNNVSPVSILSIFASFEEKWIESVGNWLARVSKSILLSTARTSWLCSIT